MKVWIDDVRPAPDGYVWIKSVNEAKHIISYWFFQRFLDIEVIDMDHDAGDYAKDGGDYIKLLDWFEWIGFDFPIHIHSMNVVGIQNMRAIIQRNGWREI